MEESSQEKPVHIEVAQLEGLVAAAGKDVTQEIVDAFWRSTEHLLSSLAAELRNGAFDEAAKAAHAIKGSASNIGAAKLSDTAARLETACKSEDATDADTLLVASAEDFAVAREEITEFLQKSA